MSLPPQSRSLQAETPMPEPAEQPAEGSDAFLECAGIKESELAELLGLLSATDVSELHVRAGAASLTLRREVVVGADSEDAPLPSDTGGEDADGSNGNLVTVTSSLVGIFHPLVQPGEEVVQAQRLGAIEALGLPTELEAPAAGYVADLLVEDGQPVQFGQPLLLLRKEAAAPPP